MKFSINDFFSKCDKFPADLVTLTEEIFKGKLHFLCSENCVKALRVTKIVKKKSKFERV